MHVRVNGQLVQDARSHEEQRAERELYLKAHYLKKEAGDMLKLGSRDEIKEALSQHKRCHGCDKAMRLALNIVMAERTDRKTKC